MWEGKSRRCDPQVRTPGHWDVPVLACGRDWRERRQRRAHAPLAFVFLFLHSCFSSPRSQRTHRRAPAQTAPTIHETVVVTATGREMPESKVGASITVLDREQIEQRHALSTIDLLQNDPRRRRGALGRRRQPDGVFVRGGESTYNKVLLDGMPLNEPGGAFNFASLSPENIERIEVLRGAHSALFGSDAMASVIQLFSVRPETRPAAG